MFTQKKDYLQKMIQQLARALAALAGVRIEQRADEGASLIRQASVDLLGMEYDVLLRMDVVSVAALLEKRERLEVLARLVEEEAKLADDTPGDARGALLRAKALALLEQARELPGPGLPPVPF